ncbi:hypothetical protein WA026_003084 [Henosepilachna vigintioctopunctata]|uniref:Bromodomain adjacent to zinc finger domain protein 1A n=1 Tax=Henosepilachna vigintioctopunctata TaxID=420089 RepID=A0AAW1TNK8_9CUCU
MPLLKKRSFERSSAPEFLRDDEEVFFCEITNEIFRNYEEFAERMLLCTSMVWTCSMTGKSNLTYEEALESEENARKSIKEFPYELRIPVLYIASKTNRKGFGEMAEDVFLYCKDRYFIGEKLETSFTGNKWVESHVLQVLPPTEDVLKASSPQNGGVVKHSNYPASLYKYEIEHLDAEDEDISEIMIVDFNQIRRKKLTFNREKCKLYLKQFVEQDDRGHCVIKPSTLKDFGIEKMTFDKIFAGPEPHFDSSKKVEKRLPESKKAVTAVNGKKSRQETLAKYLTKMNGTKNNGSNDIKKKNEQKSSEQKADLLLQMEKRKEEFENSRKKKEEEKLAEKEKKKQVHLELSNQLKEWTKVRDDLELENQQALPIFSPIKSKIPDRYIGDVLMVMEFIKSFEKILKTRNFFQAGVTFEIMERALLEEEVAGPLIDLIQMLLTALFREQEEENSEYSMQLAKPSFLRQIDVNNMTLEGAVKFAILAAKWPKEHQGLSVRNLPLYSLTVSEVLRLHLLSSGAKLQESGERGRFTQRGGYNCTDDPGLYLRFKKPHILRMLAVKNVVQLRIKDKLAILTCLMEQLLTYSDIRDTIEDRIEKNRQVKLELKMSQISERKRENEYNAALRNMKRDAKTNKQDPKVTEQEVERLNAANEKRKLQSDRQKETYMKSAYDKEMFLGMDRAYRKYYKLESLPGVFIDSAEDQPGHCLIEPVKHIPELVNADKTAVADYFRNYLETVMNGGIGKTPSKMNGHSTTVEKDEDSFNKFLMCSSNENTCIVHSKNRHDSWRFLPSTDTLEELVKALNTRGFRESELLQMLQNDKDSLTKFIKNTPVQQLNPNLVVSEEDAKLKVATRGKKNYMDANFGFPPAPPSRRSCRTPLPTTFWKWRKRSTLVALDYNNFNRDIVRREYAENGDIKTEAGDDEDEEIGPDVKKKCGNFDPGTYLGTSPGGCGDGTTDSEDEEKEPGQSKEVKTAVECLAIALAQVAQSVEPKFLQKPLGDSSDKNLATYIPSRNRLENWEQSLLTSTSFSQVFLHYSTLDSCIMWNRSTLLAKCKICRRQKDSENMLLCDSCNLGHHLYCLKPKLTSIPKGDWFCDKCTVAKEKEKRKAGSEIMPKKKRRLFKEEEQEEEEEVEDVKEDTDQEEEESEEEKEESDEEEEEDNSDNEEDESASKVELCSSCNSGGVMITCDACGTFYHKECVDPPIRRVKANWVCHDCKNTPKEDREEYVEHKNNNNTRSSRSRRSDRDSKRKEFAEDSDAEESHHKNSKRKRSYRRESGRDDLPLHNAALQDLLTEVMKHPDAWPFLRPVQKNEVPDYHDVISNPMDFGTIKYKLNMGEYNTDAQLMYDSALVFQNCNTYNEMDSEIYRCGVRLLESFRRKCKELGLKIPGNDQQEESNKRRRRKLY